MHTRWQIAISAGAAAALGALAATLPPAPQLLNAVTATTAVVATTTLIALMLLRRWLTALGARLSDATQERRELRNQTAQAQAAVLAYAAIREQLIADTAAKERAADERANAAEAAAEAAADRRIAEQTAAIRQEFEETRAVERAEMYELGAMNERNGEHSRPVQPVAELILLSDRRRQHNPTSFGTGVSSP